MKKLLSIFSLLQWYVLPVLAQHGDSLALGFLSQEVEIRSELTHSKDTVSLSKEMTSVSSHLGQYLQSHGYGQIQAYGPEGTLCYLRFRGTSADHTTVYWNEIPLNSITLGGIDVSMVPLFFVDGVELDRTQHQSSRQWNNVGNGLYLRSGNRGDGYGFHTRIFQSANTLNNFTTGAELGWKLALKSRKSSSNANKKNWDLTGTSRLLHQSISNDFQYIDPFQLERPRITQEHNNGLNKGFMQNLTLSRGNLRWDADLWLQERRMELPLRMGQHGHSTQQQDDQLYRMVVRFSKSSSKYQWNAGYAESYENLMFRDHLQSNGEWLIDSKVKSVSRLAHVKASSGGHKDFQWSAMAMGVQNEVENTNYKDDRFEQYYAQTSVDLKWDFLRNTLLAGARKEWRTSQTKWNWNLALQRGGYLHFMRCSWKSQLLLSHRFRTPDLNDLYWVPGGNANLLPEEGLSYEWHSDLTWRCSSKCRINTKFNAYRTVMQDLIIWSPTDANQWSPHNEQHVVSSGLDGVIAGEYVGTKCHIDVKHRIQWNQSVSDGKILPYSPEWIQSTQLNCSFKPWRFEISYVFTSLRYTEQENKRRLALNEYALWNATIQRQLTISGHTGFLSMGVVNALNTEFQSVRGIAMPGRYFQLQFNYQFSKIKKSNHENEIIVDTDRF